MGRPPAVLVTASVKTSQHELYHGAVCQAYQSRRYDIVGGSEMLMGLCITVTCIVELPIFAANNWILKTLGVNSVIHVTLAVCVIRMVGVLHMRTADEDYWKCYACPHLHGVSQKLCLLCKTALHLCCLLQHEIFNGSTTNTASIGAGMPTFVPHSPPPSSLLRELHALALSDAPHALTHSRSHPYATPSFQCILF